MTVPVQVPEARSTASGLTGTFALGFGYEDASHVKVSVEVDGVETLLTQGADYTISGGNAVLVEVPEAGALVRRWRETPILQGEEFGDTVKFQPVRNESAFNRLTRINQEQAAQLARAVKVGIGETPPDPDDILAAAALAAGKADIDLDNVTAPNVLRVAGVSSRRDFVAGMDNTDQLAAVGEADAGLWVIPPCEPDEDYLISEQLPAFAMTGKTLRMQGARFKRNWDPDPEAPASFILVSDDTTDFEIDGGAFDFDAATVADVCENLAANRWAAVSIDGDGIARGKVRIRALNVPGLGVYVNGGDDRASSIDVTVHTIGCAAALIYEEVNGGEVRFLAEDSTNRFAGGRMANFNGQVALLREFEGVTLQPSWIKGVTGKKNNNTNPATGIAWSEFYSGLTVLNGRLSRIIAPLLTGMVNDEALDADCLNYLAMSFVGEDLDIISPRVMSGCALAIELMTTEGGLNVSNLYVDQFYENPRVTSGQGVVWKGGGLEEPPDRAGRLSTPGRTSLMNGGVVRGCPGDAYRFRNPGMQLAGTLVADAPAGYGFNFDHLDKTSSGMGTGHLAKPERDYAAPRLLAINPGKTGIALNCGERIDVINGQGTGAGWNAKTRESAAGIGHPEQSDTETGTGVVSVGIFGGNFKGAPNETIAKAVSFVPGPPSEIRPRTPWPMQKMLRSTDPRMGRQGSMFRIRDVLGAGIDALCRVIHMDGDKFVVAYEPLQELTGTWTFDAATRTMSGTGGAALTELVAGQRLYWPNGVYMDVESITNNDAVVMTAAVSMTGSITVAKTVERVLTASPDWTDTGFLTAITGTVSMNAGNKTINGHDGSNFSGDILGPCWLKIGGEYVALRIVTDDDTMSIFDPGAVNTVTEASNTTAYMVLADIETFDPMHHSIRFDDSFTASLQILDPKTGNTISDAVTVPLDKIDGPSRFVLETRKDFAVAPAANIDILTLPVGFRPLGVSGRVHTALTGATSPTSLDLFVTDTSNAVVGVAVASLLASGGNIPAGATGRGAWPVSTAIPTAGWELRGSRVGGSGSFSAGVFEVNLLVAFDAPAMPLVRGAQL